MSIFTSENIIKISGKCRNWRSQYDTLQWIYIYKPGFFQSYGKSNNTNFYQYLSSINSLQALPTSSRVKMMLLERFLFTNQNFF